MRFRDLDTEIQQGRFFAAVGIFMALMFGLVAVLDGQQFAVMGWVGAFSGWWLVGVTSLTLGNQRAELWRLRQQVSYLTDDRAAQ